MKKKEVAFRLTGFVLIAALIAMVVLVGTASANGGAEIYGSHVFGDFEKRHNFTTTNNLYGWGDFGGYSYTYGGPPCPVGCGGRVYVVEHQESWSNGTPLIDVSSDGYETVAWGNTYFQMAWPTPLTPGTYDLILDLNVSGYLGVWTHIPNPYSGEENIIDPIWIINVTGPAEPGISITKTASTNGTCPGIDPLTANIGDTVTYCFNVTNTGSEMLTNVTAIDDIYGVVPLGTTTLGPGNSTSVTITHVVTESDICNDITNTATVNATDPSGNPVGPETDTATVTTDYTASLAITKVANTTGPVDVGDVIEYNITVKNTGDVNLTMVNVTDDLTKFNHEIAKLEPDESQSFKPTYTVTESDICNDITNTATVNGTDPCGYPVEPKTATATVTTDYTASLAITKVANTTGPVTVGDVIEYNITVKNTGDVNLTMVNVTDALTKFNHEIAKLEPDESQSFKPSYTVTESDICNDITNTATVNGTDPCGYPVEPKTATATVTTDYTASLAITKVANTTGPVTVGDVIEYNITVKNTGDVNLTMVNVTDALTKFNHEIAKLEPDESQSFKPSYTVTESDICNDITNTATVNGTDPCGYPVEPKTATATVTTDYTASLAITKVANTTGPVTVGDVIEYNITVKNTGDVNLTMVNVTDALTKFNHEIAKLEPDESQSFKPSYTVTESDICNNITNTATVNGTDPCGYPVEPKTATATVTTDYTASLAITKVANTTGPVTVGDVIEYTINVSNTGNMNLTNVLVTDSLTGLSQTIPTLTPGASQTFNPSYTVTQADICAPINNTATVNGTGPCGGAVGPEHASVSVPAEFLSSIAIAKTANVTSATVGTVIGYTINVSNTGNMNLTNVLVTDSLTGLSQTIPTLTPGASQTFNPSYTVTQSDICAPINNTATANGTDPCGGAVGPEHASVSVPTEFLSSIAITKTANVTSATVGTVIGYTINVSNTGNMNLTNVLVTDSLTGLSQTIPTLTPGASQTFNPSYTVTQADICAPINNTATANGTDPCGGTVNDSDQCTVNVEFGSGIHIDKTASTTGTCPGTDPLTVNISDNVTYCFSITNTGNVSLSNITVSDDHYGEISLPKTELKPDESTVGTTTHTVNESDVPQVINNALVRGMNLAGGIATDTDDCTVNVDTHPGINITKTVDPPAVGPGMDVTFTINATNTGDCTLKSVQINESLPAGMSFVSSIPVPDTIIGGTLIWNDITGGAGLAPGATSTITMIVHIAEDAEGILRNVVVVNTTPPSPPKNDTENVTVADVEVNKSGTPSIVAPGGNVTYTITYINTGNATLTDVVIIEHYPAGVTFISASPAPDPGTNNVWTIGTLAVGASGEINITVKVPESIDLTFAESGSVIGEGFVMISKELSTEQMPYIFTNVVTLSCTELGPVSDTATTTVSGVPGTSMSITEHGSGIYESDESIDLCTRNRSVSIVKTTNAVYKPTTFSFSKSFVVNFTPKWKQDIETKNCVVDNVIRKLITDATYIDDETRSKADNTSTTMEFDSSFNGSLYIGARINDTAISETYIGEFDVLQQIQIGKGPIPSPSPTPTPTWLPCPTPDP